MHGTLKIGTRDSELAVWQATEVKNLLARNQIKSELVFVKSEGDIDLITPLYAMGVQGIFTRTLDSALLNNRIDIAVHSMKDVPTQLPEGIAQAAVLKRASYKDVLIFKDKARFDDLNSKLTIATSSIRRKAQWLHRYPDHCIENLRGNVNTRLRKVIDNLHWDGAIFAAAGLERINLLPENSVELDWMLPAPAQGAIMIVCRTDDTSCLEDCKPLNDALTALCTKIERDFLSTLMGGCSTPISALAEIKDDIVSFKGNICSTDGKTVINIEKECSIKDAATLGIITGKELLNNISVAQILEQIRNEKH